MKTTKLRGIVLPAISILLMVSLYGCTKNDETIKPNLLIGSWKAVSLTISVFNAEDKLLGRETMNIPEFGTLTFRADGTVIDDDGINQNWTLKGNILSVQQTEGSKTITQQMKVEELTSNKLTLSVREDDLKDYDGDMPDDAKYLLLTMHFNKIN